MTAVYGRYKRNPALLIAGFTVYCAGSPRKLVADGEGRDTFRTHLHLVDTADRNGQCAGNRRGREAPERLFLAVGHRIDPF